MKHILNDLSNEEKNSIREQHTGGMKVMTENFSKLLNSKLGDSKPIVEQPSPKVQRAPQVSTPITKPTQSPQLIGMYDMLGRRVYNVKENELVIYIYSDGTSKKIIRN